MDRQMAPALLHRSAHDAHLGQRCDASIPQLVEEAAGFFELEPDKQHRPSGTVLCVAPGPWAPG